MVNNSNLKIQKNLSSTMILLKFDPGHKELKQAHLSFFEE